MFSTRHALDDRPGGVAGVWRALYRAAVSSRVRWRGCVAKIVAAWRMGSRDVERSADGETRGTSDRRRVRARLEARGFRWTRSRIPRPSLPVPSRAGSRPCASGFRARAERAPRSSRGAESASSSARDPEGRGRPTTCGSALPAQAGGVTAWWHRVRFGSQNVYLSRALRIGNAPPPRDGHLETTPPRTDFRVRAERLAFNITGEGS